MIRIPRRAALAMAALTAVGVASPAAQGQAMTSTVMLRRMLPVTAKTPPARRKERGTVRRAKRSARVWMGACTSRASSTRRMMRPMVVSAPTRAARTRSDPLSTSVPA